MTIGEIPRGPRVVGGVGLDTVELYEGEILPDRIDVLRYGGEDRLLELACELKAARTQDVDVGAIDQQVEIVV